jgi:hypothetical protein
VIAVDDIQFATLPLEPFSIENFILDPETMQLAEFRLVGIAAVRYLESLHIFAVHFGADDDGLRVVARLR